MKYEGVTLNEEGKRARRIWLDDMRDAINDLERLTKRGPYGYARYVGRLKQSGVIDQLRALHREFEKDTEPL